MKQNNKKLTDFFDHEGQVYWVQTYQLSSRSSNDSSRSGERAAGSSQHPSALRVQSGGGDHPLLGYPDPQGPLCPHP